MFDIFKIILELSDSLGLKDIFKGKEQKLIEFQLALQNKMNELNKSQIELNKVEAQNSNIFISGWRPFVGWVCGSALAYQFILRDFIIYFMKIFGSTAEAPPQLDLTQLITILLAMLGMYYTRTYEKIRLKK